MSDNKNTWIAVTDPAEIKKINDATQAVLDGKRPAGPPAAGSAGIPWGGADASRHWKPL